MTCCSRCDPRRLVGSAQLEAVPSSIKWHAGSQEDGELSGFAAGPKATPSSSTSEPWRGSSPTARSSRRPSERTTRAKTQNLELHRNNIGARDAKAVAAAMEKIATLTRLDLGRNDIGAGVMTADWRSRRLWTRTKPLQYLNPSCITAATGPRPTNNPTTPTLSLRLLLDAYVWHRPERQQPWVYV